MRLHSTRILSVAFTLLSAAAVPLVAQSAQAVDSVKNSGASSTTGFMGTAVLTHASPAYDNRAFTELQLIQPVLMTALRRRGFTFLGALNAEGYTLRRGELNAGIWGEGYVDRRHPHTLVHEAMLGWQSNANAGVSAAGASSVSYSIAAGRGFVPFGSDDPMMRPFEKYPVNHHHSQILERVQAIGAARVTRGAQAVTVEAATFNGDEPAGPFHGPRWSRFGDSWAVRATGELFRGVEISGSRASVVSPELQQGGAFNHRQHHAALRFDRSSEKGEPRYFLAEWARTDEITNGQTAFQYHSALVEGQYGWPRAVAAVRLERTERGEQGRLLDPFRSPLGHVDFQILGVTKWEVVTIALSAPFSTNVRAVPSLAEPFLEVARAVPTSKNRPTAFEPAAFYGASALWSVSAGVRVHVGSMRARMGRYGVLSQSSRPHAVHHDTHGSMQ